MKVLLPGSRYTGASVAIWIVACTFSINVDATFVIPYDRTTDVFTAIEVQPQANGVGRIGEANLDTSTSFSGAIEYDGGVGGTVAGDGLATFTSLGAKVTVTEGSNVRLHEGFAIATANERFTVAAPAGVASGSPGTMSLNFRLGGTTIVDYNVAALHEDRTNGVVHPGGPPDLVLARLNFSVQQRTGSSPFASGALQKDLILIEDLPTGGVSDTSPFNLGVNNEDFGIDINFNYDEPFFVTTRLLIHGVVDNGPTPSLDNPYINEVDVDFLNTARLIAIINEDHPDAQVFGVGGTYDHLVMDSVPPVPVPPAIWLFASALLFLLQRRTFRFLHLKSAITGFRHEGG